MTDIEKNAQVILIKEMLKEIDSTYDLNYGEILIDPREFYDLIESFLPTNWKRGVASMIVYGIFGDDARTDDDNIVAIFTTKEKAREYIEEYMPSYEWWTIIELDVREWEEKLEKILDKLKLLCYN